MWPMKIQLEVLPDLFLQRGAYPSPKGTNFPRRAAIVHHRFAEALIQLEAMYPSCIYWTDLYRSAQSSRAALAMVKAGKKKPGVQPPGFSHHGYGGAGDLHVERTLKLLKMSYSELLRTFEKFNLYCHRRDGKTGHEGWHFNYLEPEYVAEFFKGVSKTNSATWATPAERRIRKLYGSWFTLDNQEIQRALSEEGLYHGKFDGLIGPLTKKAITQFQVTWGLRTGSMDTRTMRTLSFVTARAGQWGPTIADPDQEPGK